MFVSKVSIKDVAKKANVSITTVSRVLNNKPDVSVETKKRIEEVIRQLKYNPSDIARGLVLRKTNTIGLVIPDISNPFFPEVIKGIGKTAKKMGYSLILFDTDNDKAEERESINLLRNKMVDGIILSLSLENKDVLKALERDKFPIIQIDRQIADSIYPAITIDNRNSAFMATEYLIKHGHRKVAHVTGDLMTKTAVDRLDGYKQALKENEITYNEKWIFQGDYSWESGKELMKTVMKSSDRPTAIFFANDVMAFGAYETIYEKQCSIPEDFSIIGHDNIKIASFVKPGLTTMDQPKCQLGEEAVRQLISMIENTEDYSFQNIVLDNNIIIRDSVGTI